MYYYYYMSLTGSLSHIIVQEVKDISGGCGQSFEVLIVSNVFDGKPLLQRHRLVNECLKEEISQIHAFTQKTYTPAQWDKMNSS